MGDSHRPSLHHASLSACCTPSFPATAQMLRLYLLQRCHTHIIARCRASTSFSRNAAVHAAPPSCDKTPSSNPNPNPNPNRSGAFSTARHQPRPEGTGLSAWRPVVMVRVRFIIRVIGLSAGRPALLHLCMYTHAI